MNELNVPLEKNGRQQGAITIVDQAKAFQLMNEKNVDISVFKRCRNVISFNTQTYGKRLDNSEFDFLKRVVGQ